MLGTRSSCDSFIFMSLNNHASKVEAEFLSTGLLYQWDQLEIKEVLGEGAFGIVYKGTLKCGSSQPKEVAVKSLKGTTND